MVNIESFKPDHTQTNSEAPCLAMANVASLNAERYLRRMARHFAHKIRVTESETGVHFEFGMGECSLGIDGQKLHFVCRALSSSDLEEVRKTIHSHFERFAENEQLSLKWNLVSA